MNVLYAAMREYVADVHPGWGMLDIANSPNSFAVARLGKISSYVLVVHMTDGRSDYMAVFYSGGCLATYSYTHFDALDIVSECIKMIEEMDEVSLAGDCT